MIRIYGASDDLVELEEDGRPLEEVGCYGCEVLLLIGDDEPLPGDVRAEGVLVSIHHGPFGWMVGVASVDDESAKAPWALRLDHEHYSPAIEVDCPRGTKVRGKKRRTGGEWPTEWRNARDWEDGE